MRRTFVTMAAAAIVIAAVIGMPGSASAQVVIIVGNGAAQPYYPPYPYPYPFPQPFPQQQVVYGGYYPSFGYVAASNRHYSRHRNGYYGGGYYPSYGYGW